MLENYFPVLLFIVVGLAVGVVAMSVGYFLAPHRPDSQKLSPYECGFEAFEDARMKFDVRYYLVAILLHSVPATIIKSDWRGLGRNTMPKRSRS